MSAVVGEPGAGGSQKYVNFDEYVEFQVNKTRAGIRYTDLLLAVVMVLLVGAGYLLLFVIADHWLIEGGLSDWTRTILLSGVTAFIVGWTTWKIILPYWKRVTALYAARELEASQPQLKSSLLTLIDLKGAGRAISPHILTAMEKRAALQLSQIDVEQAVDRRPLMRLAFALFGVLLAFCLYTVFSPKPIGPSLLRALIPIADVGVATRTRIVKVDPGATSILARSQLKVIVDLEGEIPPEATLLYTTRDHSLVDEPVVLRDTGEGLHRFQGTLSGPNGRGLLQSFEYRVVAGDARSETFAVTVEQAPYATVESVSYAYPAYMGLDAKTQTGGDIDAWEGTQVTIRGSTNMPVAGATLKFHDTEDTSLKGEEVLMRLVDETHFEVTRTLQFRSDGSFAKYYRIDLRTADGQRDPFPRLYTQSIRRDLPPEITLLHPTGDLELPANAVLPLSFTARDPDFMLRTVRMRFEQREQKLDAKTRHLYDAPPYRSELSGRSELKLSEFKLQPGDVLTFYLEAWDNMSPLGQKEGNRAVTPKINISIAAEAPPEQVDQLREEAAQAAQERLDEAESQQNAERGEGEPSAEDSAEEEQPSEPGTETNPGDAEANPGEQAAGEQQNSPGTADGKQSDSPEEGGSTASQPQPAGEQSPDPAEQSPQGQQSGGEGKSGQQSQTGKAQASNNGASEQGEPRGQSGSQSQTRSQPQPGQEASDDEALAKLLKKYEEQIKQEQQKQQQQAKQQPSQDGTDQDQSGDSQSGDQPGTKGQQRQQPGDDGQSSSDASSGDSDPSGSDDSPPSSSSPRRSEATKPQDDRNTQPSPSDGDSDPNGDAPQPDSGDPRGQQPDKQTPNEGKAEEPRSSADPREQQDPRTAPLNDNQRGESQPNDRPEASASDEGADATASPPMTGASNPSESTSPSGQSPQSEPGKSASSDSKPTSADQPAGEQPEGQDRADDGQAPANRDENSQGDQQKQGRGESKESKRSQTGDQPKGPDEQNPGEGRKNGQRSEQPETGEQGSSSQTSEGQSSSESGDGEPSENAGSKSAGESGQPSPGAGKQASENQKGQQQSGAGEQSQAGPEGSKSEQSPGDQPPGSEGGDSESPSDAGQTGANKGKQGQQQGGKSGEQSPSGGEKSPPGESGEKGADGAKSQAGDQQKQEQGAGAEQGEGAQKQSAEKGSGEKGGGEKAGGEKGGGEQEGGEQGGKQSGGQEGGGEEGGGEPGGEQSGAGESKQPGNAPKGGKPGTGQPSGGAVGAGGKGQNSGEVPQGGGGSGAGDAGPADPADLSDRKRATELVLQKLQDELSRGDVSPELLQDLGWSEQNLREFMDRLDRRLSDTGEDQSPEAEARRRQFNEILRGIDYQSEGQEKAADTRERPTAAGAGPTPRLPAPSEFRGVEESFRQKLSRETKSK